jgi:WD40 repeat protein
MSTTAFTPPKIQKRTLKGHTKAVLCLAHSSERLAYSSTATKNGKGTKKGNRSKQSNCSGEASTTSGLSHPSLLLSGSEDGTARLWDLRTRKTAYCMVLPSRSEGEMMEVTSVAFHPSILEVDNESKIEANDAFLKKGRNYTV